MRRRTPIIRASNRYQRKSPNRTIVRFGAEGETAPETLRPMDRWKMTLWKAIFRRVRKIHRRR